MINYAKKERIKKQYYSNSGLTKKDAKEILNLSEEFIEKLEMFIEQISLDDIKRFRGKFGELIEE